MITKKKEKNGSVKGRVENVGVVQMRGKERREKNRTLLF